MGNLMWSGPQDSALVQVPMDMLTLIYDRRSAQTHVVASPVPEILAVLGADCCSETNIMARLMAIFDIDSDQNAAAMLRERLHDMAALGLIASSQ